MRRFFRLPFRLQRVAVAAAFMAPRVKRRLRRAGCEATAEWLDRRQRPAIDDLGEAMAIARIAQAVMTRMPASYNCLDRSLVVWTLVGGKGSARLRLGVHPNDDGTGLKFHAWVEKDTVVINDVANVASTYAPFTAPPPATIEFD